MVRQITNRPARKLNINVGKTERQKYVKEDDITSKIICAKMLLSQNKENITHPRRNK